MPFHMMELNTALKDLEYLLDLSKAKSFFGLYFYHGLHLLASGLRSAFSTNNMLIKTNMETNSHLQYAWFLRNKKTKKFQFYVLYVPYWSEIPKTERQWKINYGPVPCEFTCQLFPGWSFDHHSSWPIPFSGPISTVFRFCGV